MLLSRIFDCLGGYLLLIARYLGLLVVTARYLVVTARYVFIITLGEKKITEYCRLFK